MEVLFSHAEPETSVSTESNRHWEGRVDIPRLVHVRPKFPGLRFRLTWETA